MASSFQYLKLNFIWAARGSLLELLLGLSCLVSGCLCGGPEPIAELTGAEGAIERDFADKVGQWNAAQIGDGFFLGDGVQAKVNSGAVIELADETYIRLMAKSRIRFLKDFVADKPLAAGIDVETGDAELVVGKAGYSLHTVVGMAVLDPNSRVMLSKKDGKIQFAVDIGKATLITDSGNTEMGPNDVFAIDIGTAVIEKVVPLKEKDEAPKTSDEDKSALTSETSADGGVSGEAIAAAPENSTKSQGTNKNGKEIPVVSLDPGYADFSVAAGESFTIHAMKPPVGVEIMFGKVCSNGGVITVHRKKGESRGARSGRILVTAGRASVYKVYCLAEDGTKKDKVAARGKIRVIRDAGKTKVPRKAPVSNVDLDGRLYKVSFQNQLPKIVVTWPRAPSAGEYLLHIDERKTKRSKKPRYTLSSGTLREGTHSLRFETVGSKKYSSRKTNVKIDFDNEAPKATLTAPKEYGFSSGETVGVRGIAARGWKIRVNNGSLSVDKQNRFDGTVTLSGGYRSIAVRLAHPKRGVHYYLRRARN